MRVLIVAEQLRRAVPGGIGTYARGLLQGLRQQPDVEVVVYRSRVPSPLLTRAWDLGLRGAPKGFDVVHAVSLAAPPSASPLSVMVHDLAWRRLPDAYPARGRRWHEAALKRALRRAEVLIVPSRQTAADLRDRRVHVVEEGSDHLPPPDHAGAAAVLERLGVVGHYLLTVSTLEPRKNLPRLMAAYRRSGLEIPLVVVGPSGWGPSLKPEPGVLPAGYVDEGVKAALLAGARCLAYVPLFEGFGLPAVEAMAVGTPVVASPMPSIGQAALVVDPADTDDIAAALVTAAEDEAVRVDLAGRGRRRAGELTWAESARQHVELWRTLL